MKQVTVKVMIKNYSGYEVYTGVIVDIPVFNETPVIQVLYCKGTTTPEFNFAIIKDGIES